MRKLEESTITISGNVAPEFETMRESFLSNFEQGQEIGAAVAVYHRGKAVVDLVAGLRDRVSGEPYSHETLQPVFSATKGITALAANMLAERGQLDFDAPVASHWPQFAQAGKSDIPVRWVLTHQSGVLGLDRTISLEQLLDWNLVVNLLAAQAPDWKPGSKHGYHSMTYGFLVGEVVRRVTGKTLGRYVAREIAGALNADLFIGLPQNKETRVAQPLLPELHGQRPRLPDCGPYASRVLNWISPPLKPTDVNRSDVRAADLPAIPPPATRECSVSPRHVTCRWIEPRPLPYEAALNGNSGLRLSLADSPHHASRIEFLVVRTGRSPLLLPTPCHHDAVAGWLRVTLTRRGLPSL